MRLTIPTNWDNKLIEGCQGLPVHTVYGKMRYDLIGGGRPAGALPEVTKEQVKEHIKLVHDQGFAFNYLMNASCVGNLISQPKIYDQMRHYLDWIAEIKANYITVSIPFLIEFIHRYYPEFKLVVSVFSHVDSVDQALYYESLGAVEITIVQMYNRDFSFLSQFRNRITADLQIIVNNACLYGCPYRRYHANINSHSTMTGNDNIGFDYPVVSCTCNRFNKPEEWIKSPWIRPGDLHYYEEIGIDKFKISGRTKTTAWLLKVIRAYADRRTPDNIMELLSVPNGALGSAKRKKYTPYDDTEIIIDNHSLGDFLPEIRKRDCQLLSCNQCGYCIRLAEKAVRFDGEACRAAGESYRGLIDNRLENN